MAWNYEVQGTRMKQWVASGAIQEKGKEGGKGEQDDADDSFEDIDFRVGECHGEQQDFLGLEFCLDPAVAARDEFPIHVPRPKLVP
jgi:hypothetical protein